MDQRSVEANLADLNLPAIQFFNTIDSTNDAAWHWVESGAPHIALVISDEQTAGHGRFDRRWITTAGSGLAFSLILLSPPLEKRKLTYLTGLGAVAACLALRKHYSLPAQVKWPNDILLNQHKTGGVLVETRWHGDALIAAVVGIGINVAPLQVEPGSLSALDESLPVTCVEDALGHSTDRMELLHHILQEFFNWLPRLTSRDFMDTWESLLAYRNQRVVLFNGANTTSTDHAINSHQEVIGKVIGLTENGALRLQTETGKLLSIQVGEIRLRPVLPPSNG